MMRRHHSLRPVCCLLLALPLACDIERTIDDELGSTERQQAEEEEQLGEGEGEGEADPANPADPEGQPAVVVSDVIVDCDYAAGYEVSTWRSPDPLAPRLWVGGVYETRDDHSGGNHPTGEGLVHWEVPGSNVLVLSAYEPTDWKVELAERGQLDKIIAIGYHQQQVFGPPGVPVRTYSYDQGNFLVACGFELPGDPNEGCTGTELVEAAESLTGLSLYGFDGCYHATTFEYVAQ
ncbi:MAG: hypothetical protein KDK70_02250 [Myxococcales bacterium]|nr:hypothetical protein [Myxococcales bacterium]